MINIEVSFQGVDKLADNLSNLNVRRGITRSLQQALLVLEREVKQVTPVDTGLLRNSYETQLRAGRLDAILNNYREYAPHVDAQQQFMDRGARNAERQIQNIFVENIEDLLINL